MCRVDYRDVLSYSTGTFCILDIPAGTAITRSYFIVETTWTSGGSATMQIQESTGSNVVMISATDGAVSNMAEGVVLAAPTGDGSDVLSNVLTHADNFHTAARTVDFITGVADWTAGVGVLVVEYVVIPQ
ncbi:MAG: hypothetical protein E3J60_04660 [Dehalococcoidia bacterium]|nr:MAG: hypothetical protein E3J60_04660 [Dehalococcoidia bacterium]